MGSCLGSFVPQLAALFGKVIEALGSEALLEDVCPWGGLQEFVPWPHFRILYFSLYFLCEDELWWASLTLPLPCCPC